jgi:hypothetical protein
MSFLSFIYLLLIHININPIHFNFFSKEINHNFYECSISNSFNKGYSKEITEKKNYFDSIMTILWKNKKILGFSLIFYSYFSYFYSINFIDMTKCIYKYSVKLFRFIKERKITTVCKFIFNVSDLLDPFLRINYFLEEQKIQKHIISYFSKRLKIIHQRHFINYMLL